LTPITDDPRDFLTAVMQGLIDPSPKQLDAAKSLVRHMSAGKKEQAADKAKAATAGRFAPKAPPKLVAVA
jgi:hypothetical protein